MPPVTYKAETARLITKTSFDRVGLGDYTVKLDWRREMDQDIRREGFDYFWPGTSGDFSTDPGTQPFPPAAGEPITLIHRAFRPNGRHAILVGTKTKLWRFSGMESGAYFDDEYFDEGDPDDPMDDYFEETSSVQWQEIGSGFSPNGHRWEALNINGYTVLNNGVDLPHTYRIEEAKAIPIYELREQGIASVGTIGETNGVLMCGDISEIHPDYLPTVLGPVGNIESGDNMGTQIGTTVTTPSPFFTAEHIGRTIVFAGGSTAKITAWTDPQKVTVDPSGAVTNERFMLKTKAVQPGAIYSGLITASTSEKLVATSGAFFDISMVGKTIRFANGFSSKIDSMTSPFVIEMETEPPEDLDWQVFWVTYGIPGIPTEPVTPLTPSAYRLTSDANFFDASMVGKTIIFEDGNERRILIVEDEKNVIVDSDLAITGFFELENPDSYAPFTDASHIDRIHYRVIWAMPDEPRRFGVSIKASMEKDSQQLTLAFPSKSFEVGQEVSVVGAGIEGGVLTGTVLNTTGDKVILDQAAQTTTEESGSLIHTDAIGSIVGFEDLQDDSSGILRILKIQKDTVAVYKDSAIYVGFYTGLADEPFRFEQIDIPEALTLHYRWTLIDVAGRYHVYAAANNFCRFDLGTGVPQILDDLDFISDIFFGQVSLEHTDEIFAADNAITNEIFFWYPPTASPHKGIVHDYKHFSASTTGMSMTAAATVKKPEAGLSTGPTEDLFLMGTAEGVILIYGKTDAVQSAWGNTKEIFYRRGATPFTDTKSSYDSQLRSGLGDLGEPYREKDLTAYVLYLASQSRNTPIRLKLFGDRNPGDATIQLVDHMIQSPHTMNLVPTFFRHHYFQWDLLVSGQDNPCRIVAHTFDVQLIGSESHQKRTNP